MNIAELNQYYLEFCDQPMGQTYIGKTTIDTGYALEGIELFIDFIKEQEQKHES